MISVSGEEAMSSLQSSADGDPSIVFFELVGSSAARKNRSVLGLPQAMRLRATLRRSLSIDMLPFDFVPLNTGNLLAQEHVDVRSPYVVASTEACGPLRAICC